MKQKQASFKNETIENVLSNISQTWEKMDKNQKLKYVKMSEEDQKRYDRELELIIYPVLVSDELCDFFDKPHGTKMTRYEAINGVIDYIYKHNLCDKSMNVTFKTDTKLKKIINLEKLGYIHKLDEYLDCYFIKEKVNEEEVNEEEVNEEVKSRILNLVPPKKAKSAYYLYTRSPYYREINKKYTDSHKFSTIGQISKHGLDVWNKMSNEEKDKYIKMEKEDKERYERELEIYEKNKVIAEEQDKVTADVIDEESEDSWEKDNYIVEHSFNPFGLEVDTRLDYENDDPLETYEEALEEAEEMIDDVHPINGGTNTQHVRITDYHSNKELFNWWRGRDCGTFPISDELSDILGRPKGMNMSKIKL